MLGGRLVDAEMDYGDDFYYVNDLYNLKLGHLPFIYATDFNNLKRGGVPFYY